MQVRTALLALAFGCPLVAHGAAKVPVAVYQVDPGTFQFAVNAQEPQSIPGPVLDWSIPAGSGHFEVVVEGSQLVVISSGTINSGALGPSQGFSVRFTTETPFKIGMIVPDFGESMTTIAFVKKRIGDEPSGLGVGISLDMSIGSSGRFSSSSLLATDLVTPSFNVSSYRRPTTSEPDLFNGGGLVSLVSGDQITRDVSFEVSARCDSGSQGGACSISWADTVGFDVFAIRPDPEVPPNKQCSDGLDNDGDGKIDYPADKQCNGAQDDTESSK